jgi:hypothetical protein
MSSGDATAALVRLSREVTMIEKKKPAGLRFVQGGDSAPLVWTVHVDSPAEYTVAGARRPCPYAGRTFAVTMKFPANYPFKAPEVRAGARSRAAPLAAASRARHRRRRRVVLPPLAALLRPRPAVPPECGAGDGRHVRR